MDNQIIIQKIQDLYEEYEVDTTFFNSLDEKKIILGMKGVLAELELNKKKEYTSEDLKFIRKIYSMFC